DQAIEEGCRLLPKLRRLVRELIKRILKPVADLDVTPRELSMEFQIVIAGNAECRSCTDHGHHYSQDVWDPRTAINEVAKEHRLTAGWMTPRAGSVCRVPEGAEQGFELSTTAMDVTDDVERSMLRPPIVPERLAIDARAGDIFVRAKDEDVPESFSVQIANRAPKLARLLTDDMRTEVPIQ